MTTPKGSDLRNAARGPLAMRLSVRYLDEHCLLPIETDENGNVVTAIGAPVDDTVVDELSRLFGQPLRLIEVPAAEIQAAILSARTEAPETGAEAPADLQSLANQAPVITLVNSLFTDALRARASDVHLETNGRGLRVRFRLDGVLHDISQLAPQYEAGVISRVKVMAGLNIAERRLPQDGRARVQVGDVPFDMRVSTLPAMHGESVVLRILDHGDMARDLGDLGMSEDTRTHFDRLIGRSSGIVLVAGPTGSGKTTTLYGALRRVNLPGVKIVTVEDPIEYQIEGVTQVPVNRKSGLTFASVLRSILRHDPDIIMVGEMRDRETAEISIQAALTGHLVFSTLHTNDAPAAITRLVNMGIEPYMVAATVQGVLAQRLVRIKCTDCGGAGCVACTQSGFRGRTGIYQLMTVTEGLRDRIAQRAPLADIRALAGAQRMATLQQEGMRKVEQGITTIEEVSRVASDEVESWPM